MVEPITMRAPLFVPANRPERFAKAAASGADVVILDLEDAVAPEAKAVARAALATRFTDLPVLLRINAHGTPWHQADLAAAANLSLAGIILPKAEDPWILTETAERSGHPLIALVENARGLARARELAAAEGVARLAFGSVDYCADLGCEHRRELLLPARTELVLASRLAGIAPPIDGVTLRLDDPAIAQGDAAHAKALGMGGKLCIHPRQIAAVLAGFAPSAAEIAWARQVLASGGGVTSVEGVMVDEPVRIRARAVLRGLTLEELG